MVDAQLEHGPAGAEQLRGHRQRAELERPADDRVGEWAGNRVVAEFLEGHGQVDRALLGEFGDAEGRQIVGRVLEGAVQRVGELLPLLGKREPHRSPRGSPSRRSAMMSRWISLVPA